MKLNVNTSIVDYLKSKGQDSSPTARAALAEQHGIKNYSRTASQNIQLLNILKNQTAPAPGVTPEAPAATPTPTVVPGGIPTPIKEETPLPPPPVTPAARDQIVGGSDAIREDQNVVRSESQRVLNDLDAVQQLRQETTQSSLAQLQDIMENTQRLISGDFTAGELKRIEDEGERAGRAFTPAIDRAKESARQGTAKASVFSGERGGFLNTQFAGQAALQSTEGDTFAGRGGEISRIKGQLELNIADLEAQQAKAIEAAKAAVRESLITGERAKLQDARALAEMATKAAQVKEDAILKRVDLINQQEQLERNRVVFGQEQQDRAFGQVAQIAEIGGEVPIELKQQMEDVYGEGFVDQLISATKAAAEASSEADNLKATDMITQILARVPEGTEIPIGDSLYTGFKEGKNTTFKEVNKNTGQVVYRTLDNKGDHVSTVIGGNVGVSKSNSGPNSSGDDDKEIKAFRNDASNLLEDLDQGKISWAGAFDSLRVKYPQATNDTINATLGGGIPYNEETGEFDTEGAYGRAVAKEED